MTPPARSVFPVMGTTASIVVAQADVLSLGAERVNEALTDVEHLLKAMDARFSHYRGDSDISRWQAGEAIDAVALDDIEFVLAQCAELERASGGVFTVRDPRTGLLDTAGFVKGHAIGRAAGLLDQSGIANAMVGVGGDVQCSGRASQDRPWRVAVQDPRQRMGVLAVIDATDLAVATSGRSERGDHLWSLTWDGAQLREDEVIDSFTVVGPRIDKADAYATIGYAMGESGIGWVARQEGYRSVVVRGDGSVAGDAALVSPA